VTADILVGVLLNAARSADHVKKFRDDSHVEVAGFQSDCFNPVEAFSEASQSFKPSLMKAVANFATPTPVQAQCWPVLLSGRDVVGIAATGSGKTIAFALPGLMYVMACKAETGNQRPAKRQRGSNGGRVRCCYPHMLVVAPTRELAIQSSRVAASAGEPADVSSVVVYGGQPKYHQTQQLLANGGADVVVATPGRLLDLMNDGVINLVRALLRQQMKATRQHLC